VISGNKGDGVLFETAVSGNLVEGNAIGTNLAGTASLGDGGDGVHLIQGNAGAPPMDNSIGGTTAGAANTVAFNGKDGIQDEEGSGNLFSTDPVFNNTALQIELDNGANNHILAPGLTALTSNPDGTTTVQGLVQGVANTTETLEFFAAPTAADNGNGQGQTFLGRKAVPIGASGTANFSATFTLPNGQGFVAATAIDANGDTSQFSKGIQGGGAGGAAADLALSASASAATVTVGQQLSYTIQVANAGPDADPGVTLTDTLPAGVQLASTSIAPASQSGSTLTFDLGTLGNGAATTITVVVVPQSPGTLASSVSVSGALSDPNPANNAQGLSTNVVAPSAPTAALTLAISAAPNPAEVGQDVTIGLDVANNGPDAATNVVLRDTLPAGAVVVAPSGATALGGVVAIPLGTIAAGGQASATLVVRLGQAGDLADSATVTADQGNPDPARGAASVTIDVGATPPAPQVVAPPTVVSLERFGFHAQPTLFVVTFSAAMDPARAEDLANYTILGPNDRPEPLASANYDPATDEVLLSPLHRLDVHRRYTLVINGTPPSGLADTFGDFLDGLGDGRPGSDFVRTFGREILAGPNDPPSRQIAPKAYRHPHSLRKPSWHLKAAAVDDVLGGVEVRRSHRRAPY
jgi:uncharacterized repeat protein (TIGR01451 family)